MNTHDKIKLPPLPEPDAYLFQHEETGLTEYVDSQQVKWGFEKANPRWQKIHGVFTERQMQAYANAQVREALKKAVSLCEVSYVHGSLEYAISRNPYFEGGCDAVEFIEQKIRALIPKEKE